MLHSWPLPSLGLQAAEMDCENDSLSEGPSTRVSSVMSDSADLAMQPRIRSPTDLVERLSPVSQALLRRPSAKWPVTIDEGKWKSATSTFDDLQRREAEWHRQAGPRLQARRDARAHMSPRRESPARARRSGSVERPVDRVWRQLQATDGRTAAGKASSPVAAPVEARPKRRLPKPAPLSREALRAA